MLIWNAIPTSDGAAADVVVGQPDFASVAPGLGLHLALRFANNTHYIQIGGIRLQLGHHDLYSGGGER